MPRKPGIWYRTQDGSYYSQINRVKEKLATGPRDEPTGPTFRAAQDKLKALLDASTMIVHPSDALISKVRDEYLFYVATRKAQGTHTQRKLYLDLFCAENPGLTFRSIRRADLTRWENEHRSYSPIKKQSRPWKDNTARNALSSVSAAVSWYAREYQLGPSPLSGMDYPPIRARGPECLISAEMHTAALRLVHPRFGQLLRALEATGARVGEVIAATAADYREDVGGLVYHREAIRRTGSHRHKTAGRGQTRVIRYTGAALAELQELVKRYPTGPLYRNAFGRKWNSGAIRKAISRIQNQLGYAHFTCHGYRHTFCTNALESGMRVEDLAKLVGDTINQILKTYEHVLETSPRLRDVLDTFRAGKGSGEYRRGAKVI